MAVGVIFATSGLQRLSTILSALSEDQRLASRLLTLALCGIAMASLAVLPELLVSGGLRSGAIILMSTGHLVALLFASASWSCLVLQLGTPPGSAAWISALGILALPLMFPERESLGAPVTFASAMLSATWLLDHRPAVAR